MEFHVFTSCIKEMVEALCQDTDQVTIQKVLKNNTLELDGLTILKQGEAVSPTIYLNDFYKEYLNGKGLQEIVDQIIQIDKTGRKQFGYPMEQFQNIEFMKSRIVYKLINQSRNKELLKQIPYRSYLDCAIVYYCSFDKIDGRYATTLIRYEHMNQWNLTEQELYDIAKRNTPIQHKAEIKNMKTMLSELFETEELQVETEELDEIFAEDTEIPMYVLTNQDRIFGAACILYQDCFHEFQNQGINLYILPSSIHEVILVPDCKQIQEEELIKMVKEVNETQVEYEEVLSDNVYYYNCNTGEIQMVNHSNRMTSY